MVWENKEKTAQPALAATVLIVKGKKEIKP
jgi:hypothetical protein